MTSYPTADKEYANWSAPDVEADVDFMQKVVAVVRSTRSDYNLPNKTKTDLYLRAFGSDVAARLKKYVDVIGTLAYSDKVAVTEAAEEIPAGCAIVTVSNKCTAHLMLKGIIDPVKEAEKLAKKRTTLMGQIDKLKKSMQIKNYEEKVPEDVRKANSDKLGQSETEVARLADAIEALKLM